MHSPGHTTKLHLLLAVGVALTGSTYAVVVATVVVAVTLARLLVRHRLGAGVSTGGSGPMRAGVLAASQHADVLDPAGTAGQGLAGLAQP
jgi:hypothetical protein